MFFKYCVAYLFFTIKNKINLPKIIISIFTLTLAIFRRSLDNKIKFCDNFVVLYLDKISSPKGGFFICKITSSIASQNIKICFISKNLISRNIFCWFALIFSSIIFCGSRLSPHFSASLILAIFFLFTL